MIGFIEGENRYQSTLFPERIDDYVDEDSAARVIDVFIDRLKKLAVRLLAEPDQKISLTDPDARSMATSGRGSGMAGYNVQAAGYTTPPHSCA